ncbi:MAG: PAS domain S-box protein [Nostoc sp. TH1S01]|nr:PAS domain S-box protein [Nostoc sp. TH1S01]
MYTRQQHLWLQSLEAVIDFSPLTVQPEATVSEVISLMATCGVDVVVVSVSQVLGWLTAQDVVKLLASGIDCQSTKITEVMQPPVITLKISEFYNITAILSLLRQYQLHILPILDEAEQLIGIVTPATICQALEQSEQSAEAERLRLLESAVVNANDSILITQVYVSNGQIEPRIVYANQAFTQMTGYPLEEVIGKTPRFSHGEKTSRAEMNRLFASVQAGLPIRTELLSYRKDGSTYWVDMNLVPIKDDQERITHFVAIHRNITERKLAEEALQRSEELFRQLTENLPQAFYVWDANQQELHYVSPAYEKIWGRSRDRLIENPQSYFAAIHPQDSDRVIAAFQTLLTGQSFSERYQIVRPDGEIRWISSKILPLKNDHGQIYRFAAIDIDVTERIQAEAAMHESERRFRAIFNATFQFSSLLTPEGNLLEANQTLLDFGGLQLQDVVGRLFWETQWWTISQAIQNQLKQAIAIAARGEFVRYEVEILGANQTVRTIDFSLKPLKDETGKIVLLISEGHDITELKQTQAALKQANQELETRVAERTIALQKTNQQLLTEITERQQAQENLEKSEERFRNLVESSYDLIWEVDHNCVYTYVSPKIRDILGYEPEAVLGKTPLDFMPAELHETLAPGFAAILASPQPFQCLENIQVHQDGHLVLLETSGVPIFDQAGKFIGYRGTNRDITERKQAETALRETQQQLQAILDHSAAAIYVIDINNRFVLINRYVEQLLNMTQEQIIGKSLYELWTPEFADAFAANNHQVITHGLPIKVEEVVPFDDGLHTYFSVKFPLKDAEGVIYAVCGLSTDITDRKLAEESLTRFHKAIESTSDAICMSDITGTVNYLNSGFSEIYGYSLEEFQAAGGAVSIFKYSAELNKVLTAVTSGESWRGEVTMQTLSGRLLQIYLRANAIKDATGKITGFVGIHTDITPRKQAEEGLKLRDRAIAASSNGIIIADASISNGPIIYVNPAFERMTGYSAAEVIGTSFRLFQSADIEQSGLQELNAAMQADKGCTVVLRNYRKNGSLWWNELNISPVYDADGVLTHYIGIQTDITERKQTETVLLVTQQRLQYLLSSSPAVIYTSKVAEDFGTTFVSNNIISITGYQPQDFTEDSNFWSSHIHPEDVTNVFAELSQILQQESYSLEYRFLHKNGTYRWVSDQGKLVRDDAGNPVEMVGYLADITQRKQLEQELRVALEKEKELNELKSRFVSMTSHEFRTPLSTILSSSELLEHYRYKWTEEKQITHLRRIQAAVKRINEMLNDVLVIGKAEAGKLEYQPSNFDLVAYCNYIIEEAQLNQNNRCEISFTSQYPSVLCCMDDKLLGHILNNLLSNAIKYSPEGSTVKLKLACEGQEAILKIQDQGIGIPQEDIPHLFESFHRAKNVGNILGTGLGLAIVKKCIDIHKGKIAVTSSLGVGTTFTVNLPLNNAMQIEGNDD